jgi:ribonuclease J
MIEICTIGGYEFVGNNMTAVKVDEDVFIFDGGYDIPSLIEMQGDEHRVVYDEKHLRKYGAIPNDLILDKLGWTDKVRAIIIGHAHLDHVGGIPHIAYRYPNAVIMGTPFSMAVLRTIANDEKIRIKNKMIIAEENATKTITGKSGAYAIDFTKATHSTIQCSFLSLNTKYGTVFYALDFKMDDTPVIGNPPNYQKIKDIGKQGVKVLIVNSLYSGAKGRTESENIARERVREAFEKVKGERSALFISTFSSHIVRLKSIIEFGSKTNRQIVVLGRSMDKYIACATEVGQCSFRNQIKVAKYRGHVNSTLKKIDKERGRYLVICTGHQAEEGSILDRIVKGNTPFRFRPGDHMIFSSSVIPVKENIDARAKMDNELKKSGVYIQDRVHVSGHGSEDDIKMLIQMLKPEHIIPTHGTPEQERPAVEIAKKMGYKEGKTVHLSQDGKVLKF